MLWLHHAQLLCSDLDTAVKFWVHPSEAIIVRDIASAGVRNVPLPAGYGHRHLYGQPPTHPGQATVHHLAYDTDDISSHPQAMGVSVTPVQADPRGNHIMAQDPEDLLLQVFQPDDHDLAELADFAPTGSTTSPNRKPHEPDTGVTSIAPAAASALTEIPTQHQPS
ncbi:Uncharacterised protein [Mycobacteroides abscessus subsp. bolletii]|uniref:VOC family protein n=1 Tax=Mycobacteroides abscessus TaxID=36809 RepID=UPI0002DE499B|nr:VOC family protein [Mycobacteroides abscessus]SHO88376.1 Uncharacterised protein [Mycobacteroides abscessus subsp. abscessus]SHZ48035.1 Uncharacterised protein [Mycobacteroides abscessus subsp. bolletii]SIF74754.1 Uncharacterised protein [Mycobacteroides abscessus subsp. abscessus]SIH98740.1 Uncharacterised protein [Mycobacteroides abscessus subsp. abscessus]SKP99585.1 Uncharacterised protein [Mycobacteroides abscessus subsp. bolletii]